MTPKGWRPDGWWKMGPAAVMCACCHEQMTVAEDQLRTCRPCQRLLKLLVGEAYALGLIRDKEGVRVSHPTYVVGGSQG